MVAGGVLNKLMPVTVVSRPMISLGLGQFSPRRAAPGTDHGHARCHRQLHRRQTNAPRCPMNQHRVSRLGHAVKVDVCCFTVSFFGSNREVISFAGARAHYYLKGWHLCSLPEILGAIVKKFSDLGQNR